MSSCLISRRGAMGLLLVAPLALLSACAGVEAPGAGSPAADRASGAAAGSPSFRNTDLGCGLEPVGALELAYARSFTIDCFEGGYRLVCVVTGERFLVVPAGAEPPAGLAADITPIRLPLEGVYLVSTSMISLVDAVGALDAVGIASVTAKTSPNEHLARLIDTGAVVFGGRYSAPDYELITASGCTFALENTKLNHVPEVRAKLSELGVTVFCEQSSSEREALGRLEWIKLIGVLFEREDEARERFDALAERIAALAAQAPTHKTITFFYVNEDGAIATRRATDYFAQMVELAGGTYMSFDPDEDDVASDEADGSDSSSSVQLVVNLEEFYVRAQEADVMVYNTTVDESVTSISDLVAKNALLADLKAVQTGAVWACDHEMYQQIASMDAIIGDIRSALLDEEPAAGFLWRLP